MSARQQDLRKYIDYPESDGQPMGETDLHRKLMSHLIEMLESFFASQANIYVSGNLMCYYEENNPSKSISPDVFVVRGVAKHERRIYKFWEEPAPNFVLEISSRKTRKEDLGKKKDLYAWLGVREYFVFDPEYKLQPPLRAFRLRGQELIEEIISQNRVISHELNLELVNDSITLRLWNPVTREFLRTPAESYAQAEAETKRAQMEAARAQAEADRADRLAAKLRELGLDPDQL
jgi:Uma2 family endonuclease